MTDVSRSAAIFCPPEPPSVGDCLPKLNCGVCGGPELFGRGRYSVAAGFQALGRWFRRGNRGGASRWAGFPWPNGFADQNLETRVSLAVMNSSRAGLPAWVWAMPRWMAAL